MDEIEMLKSIVRLNKIKQKILNEIVSLELQNKKQTAEFYEKISNYQLTYETYNKLIKRCYEIDKSKWIELLFEINHYSYGTELSSILIPNSKLLPIVRTAIDFGLTLTKFYDKKQSKNSDQLSYILNMLGLAKTDEEPKEENRQDIINEIINSDLFHTVMYKIEQDKLDLLGIFNYEDLIAIKYNLILLIPELEREYVKKEFKNMTSLYLTDNLTLRFYGLELDEYKSILDGVCISAINNMIKTVELRSEKKDNEEQLTSQIYYLFIISFLTLMSDQELKKLFLSELNDNIKVSDNNENSNKVLNYLKTKLV